MILHLAFDSKFIDIAFDNFEKVYYKKNELIIVSTKNKTKYIKYAKYSVISIFELISKNFAKKIEYYDFVVLHSLTSGFMKLILNSNKKVKFIWIGWGYDYYNLIVNGSNNLLLPKTLEISDKCRGIDKLKFHIILKKIIYRILFGVINSTQVYSRIDYFAPVLEEEYEMIKKINKNFTPKYINWNSGTLEDHFLVGFEQLTINGNNILLGNSDTDTNNHIDTFEILERLILDEQKIIVPLSYGNITYREEVIKIGKIKLGDKFMPLVDFLPFKEYNKLIASCSVVIMNHLRQQALGNIIVMMYLGAKVFLNIQNPVYSFFKEKGAIVFSIDDLNNDELNSRLIDSQIEKNRKVLEDHWGRDKIYDKTRQLINIITKEA